MSVSPSNEQLSLEMEKTPLEENSLKVSPVQNVARQDSGVPEDLASPLVDADKLLHEEDPDNTMNSECNITVIHVTESSEAPKTNGTLTNERKDYSGEGKDSKDGSDSGVEGCATEVPRVRIDRLQEPGKTGETLLASFRVKGYLVTLGSRRGRKLFENIDEILAKGLV